MRFSVIVPVYNVAEYLPACMDSLLMQSCWDWEIILVDDGSTDGSAMLCDEYAKAHPEWVRVIHQENGGLGAARNTGLEAARGEYLLFVDSDDFLTEDALDCLSRCIEETGADMITFGFYYGIDQRRIPGEASPLEGLPPFCLEQQPQLLLQTPSACLRLWHRRLFDDPAVRFPGRVWFEDLRTTPKALPACKRIVALPQRLYVYRQREGSIIHSPNLGRNLELLEALEDLRTFFQNQGWMEAYGSWLECLAVDSVLYSAQRVLMADPNASFLPEFIRYLKTAFPDYRTNPLLPRLGKKKRMVLWLLERQRYGLLRGIFTGKARIRQILSR